MKLRHAVAVLLVLAFCCRLADGETKNNLKGFNFKSSKDGKDSAATKEKSKGKLKALLSEGVKSVAAGLVANKTGGIGNDKDIGEFGEDGENDKKEDENLVMEEDNGVISHDVDIPDINVLTTSIKEEKGLSGAAIAGIVVGCCVCVAAMMAIGIVLIMKNRSAGSESSISSKGSTSSNLAFKLSIWQRP